MLHRLGCKILVIMVLGGVLGSCAPEVRYRIQVTGYSRPSAPALLPPPASFYIIDNWQAKDPALSRQVKGKIEKLLGLKGYVLTSFEQAEYYLIYSFGQGPGFRAPVPMPVYRPGGYPYYRGAWQPYPLRPVPGYGPEPPALYDRWLIVNVIAGPSYRAKKEFHRLWQGEARSVGYSPNMAATVNYLLAALFEDFGKNTGRGRVVELNENDFRAEELFFK